MRFIQSLVLLSIIVLVAFYFFDQDEISKEETMENINTVVQKKSFVDSKETLEVSTPTTGDVYRMIGKSEEDLVKSFGEPIRKDQSAYEYVWWVYTDGLTEYIQFGVLDNEIVTIYATGENLDIDPLYVGQVYEEVEEVFGFSDEVTYNNGFSSYTFRLTKEDLAMRPLTRISDEVYLQIYFDTFTDKVSSIRVVTGDVLLLQRPYEIVYRGDLPEDTNLSDENWAFVESGMEEQVLAITNVIRNRHNVNTLEWDETVRDVAYLHSKDMAENNYFSHFGLDGEGLKDRLAAKEVFYVLAGENIAAHYTDAPSAVHGWLNSEGHREALFNEAYTHIGVGIFRLYYTQNFLTKTY